MSLKSSGDEHHFQSACCAMSSQVVRSFVIVFF